MGMWVEGYSMYEKERWDEAERYGREIGINEGMSIGRSEGRETEKNAWITNLRQLGISEDVIKTAASLSNKVE